MLPVNFHEVAEYFNDNWQDYKSYVAQNRLAHREMLSLLNQFLHDNMRDSPFSFVDVGCGDSSSIGSVLLDNPINKYIGIDIAGEVLKLAPDNLANVNCEKEFIFDDMTKAIKGLQSPVDVIFSSYTVHHLSYQDKFNFIQECRGKLRAGGFFIMVDGVLEENQTRNEWLLAFEDHYKLIYPDITPEEMTQFMKHPRASDYPENIKTFEKIAYQTGWNNFRVLNKIGLLVFMVFSD